MGVDFYRMRQLMRQLQADERNVEMAFDRATHITQSFSDMPHGSGITDKVGRGAIDLEEARRVRDETLRELDVMRRELSPLLTALTENEQTIMRARYIDGDSPFSIAIHHHMSERNVFYLLHKGESHVEQQT